MVDNYIIVIENSLKEKGITAKKMLLDLGYSDSMITKWKKGSEPSVVKLLKIADYLDIDIGYMLTGIKTNLTPEEENLLKMWDKLDEVEKEVIVQQIETLIKVKEKKNKLSS